MALVVYTPLQDIFAQDSLGTKYFRSKIFWVNGISQDIMGQDILGQDIFSRYLFYKGATAKV